MIMFFLPWWTYVLIATISFTSAYGGIWLANIAEPGIRQDDEPYPCLFHVVTSGTVSWCWLEHGHSGEHVAMAQEWLMEPDDLEEWEDEAVLGAELPAPGDWQAIPETGDSFTTLPVLPQRLSRVPVQTEHNDPIPKCTVADCASCPGRTRDHTRSTD